MNEKTQAALAAARALVADADARIEVFERIGCGYILRRVPHPTERQQRQLGEAQRFLNDPSRY